MGARVTNYVVTLLLVILTISFGGALKASNSHKHHEKGRDGSWNGVEYDVGMFDHSGGENISEELGKKNTAQGQNNTANVSHEFDYYEYQNSDEWGSEWSSSSEDDDYPMKDPPHEEHDKITINNKHLTTVTASASNVDKVNSKVPILKVASTKSPSSTESPSSSSSKKNESDKENEATYWKEDEGDMDDGEEDTEQNKKKLSDLPSDSDIDADKYLNPDRYRDQINLHQIEDRILRIWTVQYPESHLPCIMLRGDMKLIVPVNPTWFNREYVEINVPQDAEATGSCTSLNKDYQEIQLKWNVSIPNKNKVFQNSVYFAFATNWTSDFSELKVPADKYALVAITVVYYNGEIGNGDNGLISYSVNDLVEYMTPMNQSMSCYRDNQQLIIGNMQLALSNMQLEAFRPNLETLTVGEFSRSVLCSSDEVYVFDAVMTYIIWFWIGALLMVLFIFGLLLALGYRRRQWQEDQSGFGYKILSA